MLLSIVLYCIILYYIISYHIILYYIYIIFITLYYIILHYIILILHYITVYHIILTIVLTIMNHHNFDCFRSQQVLKTSGGFHTSLMEPAKAKLAQARQPIPWRHAVEVSERNTEVASGEHTKNDGKIHHF